MNSASRGAAFEPCAPTEDDVESRGQANKARMTRSHNSAKSDGEQREMARRKSQHPLDELNNLQQKRLTSVAVKAVMCVCCVARSAGLSLLLLLMTDGGI